MNPHTDGKFFRFQQLFYGTWMFGEDNIHEETRNQLRSLIAELVNRVGFELEARGLSPLRTPLPPLPDFSYAVVVTDESVFFVVGASPSRMMRYSILRDLRGTGIVTTVESIAKEYEAKQGWWACVVAESPVQILALSSTEQWQWLEGPAKVMASNIDAQSRVEDQMDESLCFVIMSFSDNPRLQDFYLKAIQPTVKRLGYRCERVDEQQFNSSITARIRDNIRRARFIIADMTEARPNCYYELAVAHALDKEVIHLTNSLQDVHFDIKDFNFIVYQSIDELRKKLRERIKGTIGERRKTVSNSVQTND